MPNHEPGVQKAYPPLEGGNLRYRLYLPPAFGEQPEKRWPVLCFLHGAGEAARTGDGKEQGIEKLEEHGSPAWHAAINSPLVQDFIVVCPQRPERGRWTPSDDLDEVERILAKVYEEFQGDRTRTCLTGFSYGAEGVFEFAAKSQPDRWYALWPVDDAGQKPRSECNVRRIWLHYGNWENINRQTDHQTQTCKNLVLRDAAPFQATLAPGDLRYTDYRKYEYGHSATCAAAYADWRVYAWLR